MPNKFRLIPAPISSQETNLPGDPAPGVRQISLIDDSQYASGSAPIIMGGATEPLQNGMAPRKKKLTYTPTLTAMEVEGVEELRPLPGQMKELLPETNLLQQTGMAALQSLTFNDKEMEQMLRAIDPNIETGVGPNGGLYVNQPGGKRYVINRPGLGANDFIQLLTNTALSATTGIGGSAAKRIAYEAILQTMIEGTQELAGGDFDTAEVLLGGGGALLGEAPGVYRRAVAARPVTRAAEDAGMTREGAQAMGTMQESAAIPQVGVQAERMEDIIQPDATKVRAVQNLNLEENVPPRVVSGNPQYVEIENALANIPGTNLAVSDKQFVLDLVDRAGSFIEQYGGPTARDMPGMTDRLRISIQDTIESMANRSNDIYDELSLLVPNRTQIVNTDALDVLMKEMRAELIDLGGRSGMSQVQRDLFDELRKATGAQSAVRGGSGRAMTYAKLDQTRKKIGELLANSSSGFPVGDAASFQLSKLYGALTEAQGTVIRDIAGPEADNLWTVGKALVAERKAYEDVVKKVAGKEFNRAIVPQLGSSILSMSKGGVDDFRRIISAIPEADRVPAIASSMVKVIGQDTAQGVSPGKFALTWENITANKTAKAELEKYLPTEAMQFLDNFSIVLRGYSDAMRMPRTGAINALERYGSDQGIVQRVLPALLGGKGNMVANMLEGTTDVGFQSQQRAAADMIANPNFKRMITRKAKGEKIDRLEDNFMRSPTFIAWTQTIPQEIKKRIFSIGIAEYLFEDGSRIPGMGEDE